MLKPSAPTHQNVTAESATLGRSAGFASRFRAQWRIGAAVLACGMLAVLPAPASDDTTELKRLVDQIARGAEPDANDAAERLIERVIGPVADAFGGLESRPAEEQRRLRVALTRITAALRVRLFRSDLTAADGALFDRFYHQYPELVNRLFDPNFKTRMAALSAIPLEPNSASGLFVAAKVDDEDEDVAMAALDVAAELHDAVLGRRLAKYVQGATQAVRDGHLDAEDEDLAATVVLIVGRCCRILGDCGVPDAAPAMTDALTYFGKSRYRTYIRVPEMLDALGKLGDEQAAAALIAFLGERDLRYMRMGPQGQMILQLVGDTALLNLLRIYKLEPEAFGYLRAPAIGPDADPPPAIRPPNSSEHTQSATSEAFYGLVDAAARERAVRLFAEWHAKNGKLPANDRRPPTSQPREP